MLFWWRVRHSSWCKCFGDMKCLHFQGVTFQFWRLRRNIYTKIGHHVYENECKFGFEVFIGGEGGRWAMGSHLWSTVFRLTTVLYGGINISKVSKKTRSFSVFFLKTGFLLWNVGTTCKTARYQPDVAGFEIWDRHTFFFSFKRTIVFRNPSQNYIFWI